MLITKVAIIKLEVWLMFIIPGKAAIEAFKIKTLITKLRSPRVNQIKGFKKNWTRGLMVALIRAKTKLNSKRGMIPPFNSKPFRYRLQR